MSCCRCVALKTGAAFAAGLAVDALLYRLKHMSHVGTQVPSHRALAPRMQPLAAMSTSIGRILRIAAVAAPLALSGAAFAQADPASADSAGGGTSPNRDTAGTTDTYQQKDATDLPDARSTPPSAGALDQNAPAPSSAMPGNIAPSDNAAPSVAPGGNAPDNTPSTGVAPNDNPASDRAPSGPPDSSGAPR